MRVITFVLFIVFGLICCKAPDSRTVETLKKHMKESRVDFDKTVKHCIIIPEGGCGECIASGISFVINHKEKFSLHQKENMVIFTNIGSLKLLKRAVGNDVFKSLNCIVDTTNVYLIRGEDEIYPMVIYLDKGKPTKVEFQSPEEDGLDNLEKDL